jgi:hypothetical protein
MKGRTEGGLGVRQGERCPTFLLIGQKFEAKSLGGQVLDLKIKIFVELPLIMT